MAGIGFELKRAVHEPTYLGAIKGYLYAAIISSGPWLLAVLGLGLLGLVSVSFLPQEGRNLFAATVTHAFALSLITTGLIQLVVTRYLADKLFVNEIRVMVPTFVAVVTVVTVCQAVLMHLLLLRTALPLDYRLWAVALYIALSGIWLAMVFLNAARDFVAIVLAFAVGYAASFGSGLVLGLYFGLSGYLAGFAGGQVLLLGLLIWRIFTEFDASQPVSMKAFTYIKRYPSLVAIGVMYNLAFWIDKMVFWFSHEGISVNTFLNIFPIYDTTFFLASLTIVPALAIFIVHIETAFYDHYRRFYAAIANKESWREIQAAKEGMVNALPGMYLMLFKIQGAVAITVIALTPEIMGILHIPPSYWYIFRVAVLAMTVQVFLLVTVLLLLYLDLRGSVLIITGVFLLCNTTFTILTIVSGYAFYGYGFLYASIISLLLAFILLDNRLRHLEFLTFVRQPLNPER
jgi:uncharacterized membrane protein